MASSVLAYFFCILFPHLLSQGNANVTVLQAEVGWAREATAATEATRTVAVLAARTSAREADAARDNATLHIKDAEDRATLVEGEALERVS
jgi:hypothetical protein